jgi:hypothetical protein
MIQWTAKFDKDEDIWLEINGGYVESERWDIYAVWDGWLAYTVKFDGAACSIDPTLDLWGARVEICLGVRDKDDCQELLKAKPVAVISDPVTQKNRWTFEIEEQG